MSGPLPPVTPGDPNASNLVQGPAIGLIVTAAIGSIFQILGLLMRLGLLGLQGLLAAHEGGGLGRMFAGGLGIVFSLIGLAMAGLIVYGALQMKELRNHGLATAASVVAMIPCISPCCILGLPIGIWSLVLLLRPEVKAAFRG